MLKIDRWDRAWRETKAPSTHSRLFETKKTFNLGQRRIVFFDIHTVTPNRQFQDRYEEKQAKERSSKSEMWPGQQPSWRRPIPRWHPWWRRRFGHRGWRPLRRQSSKRHPTCALPPSGSQQSLPAPYTTNSLNPTSRYTATCSILLGLLSANRRLYSCLPSTGSCGLLPGASSQVAGSCRDKLKCSHEYAPLSGGCQWWSSPANAAADACCILLWNSDYEYGKRWHTRECSLFRCSKRARVYRILRNKGRLAPTRMTTIPETKHLSPTRPFLSGTCASFMSWRFTGSNPSPTLACP